MLLTAFELVLELLRALPFSVHGRRRGLYGPAGVGQAAVTRGIGYKTWRILPSCECAPDMNTRPQYIETYRARLLSETVLWYCGDVPKLLIGEEYVTRSICFALLACLVLIADSSARFPICSRAHERGDSCLHRIALLVAADRCRVESRQVQGFPSSPSQSKACRCFSISSAARASQRRFVDGWTLAISTQPEYV